MRQYEVWWAHMPLPVGPRPVVLLTRDDAYRYLQRVVVVEVTTTAFGIRQEVTLDRREGLSRPSVARFDNTTSIPKSWLARRLGKLGEERVVEVKRALGHTFRWPELSKL